MTITPPIANTYDGQQWVKADEYMQLLREYHRMRLTDEEREALKQAIGIVDWHKAYFSRLEKDEPLPSATLRSLLARLA